MLRTATPLALAALICACAEAPTSPSAEQLALSGSESALANPAITEATGETIYGLTSDNRLITFSSSKPNQPATEVAITGLLAGETVIGIDFRPSDLNGDAINDVGKLYGVTSASRLYVINPTTGVATFSSTLSTAISGTTIGFGFNPTVDRIRIHTDLNQNLRVNPNDGATIVDAVLTYNAGDVNFGVDPDVSATGYTNNDNNAATGTELYAIDAETNSLVEFSAAGGPNGGLLVTVGPLGVKVGLSTGFDISVQTGTAYAAIETGGSGKSSLYSIDLDTGLATKLGTLAMTKSVLLSIAVAP